MDTSATSHQDIAFALEVPLKPYSHDIVIHVYDTADRAVTDDHYQMTLNVRQEAVFYADGQPITLGDFRFQAGIPVDFTAEIVSTAWLSGATELELVGENLDLENVQVDHDKGQNISLQFRATAPDAADIDRGIELVIDDFPTMYLFYDTASSGGPLPITDLLSFPNPMTDQTWFVFNTGGTSGDGVIRVFSTAGRVIKELPFMNDGDEELSINWDGRDNSGDIPANGVYFYRIEIGEGSSRAVSDAQRLVIMR